MIVYFADRKMNIAGLASTDLREGLLIRDDVKTEDVDTGVASFGFTVPYSAGEHTDVKKIIREGNYILRNYDTECEFYTILDVEDDSEKEEISVYAEDAGLDLLNEIVGEFAAAEAQPVTYYVSQFAYDTGFEIGINEISDRTRKLSWDGESTAAARIRSVATQFDAEIGYRFDINGLKVAHKYIDFYKRRGKDIARELRLHREIGRIIEKRSIAHLVTALRVTGGIPEGEEDPVTLDGVTYDDGDIYVENGMLFSRSALAEWSRYLSETGDNVGHIVGAKTYEATTQSGLLNSAKNDLIKYSKPEVTYEAEILDLPENLKIGDTVRIIDMDGELYLSARLLKMETRASERTQTATLGDYLPLSSGISDEVRAMVEEFRRTVKSRYTWYAYADDAYGANISLSPDGKDYIGIAPNRLTETPDITNPAVYTWSLIKGSTPVIDATKEGGTTTITADGEPIAEIEDGNGIASKTDYYMLADTMVSNDLATAKTHLPHSEEGPIVSFSDGMGGIPFEAMTVSIRPLQKGSGDPSPTNIRPVSGWTGARINIVAKNIFDEEAADWKNGYYIDASGVETSHSSYKYSQTYVRVKPSTTYAVQINKGVNTSLAVSVPYYDEDLNFISRESAIPSTSAEGVLTGSFTTPDGCAYIRINLPKTDTTDIQVEEASSATEYEAFSGAYPVLWETEAGTVYFGTLDPLKGILTVTHGYIEIDGSKSVNAVENHPGCFSYSLGGDALHPVSKAETSTGWCSHYKVLTNLTAAAFYSSEYATAYAHSGLTNTVGRAFFSDPRYLEAADFKAYLEAQAQNGTPVQYVFRLETPVQYQLAPAQIEQLAGKNTVWADAGEISLTYYDEAAASWGTDPLEPNAYSKFLWWKYGTTYTDDPSAEVISDPAIIGVYNLDWLEDTQKAKDAADTAAGMAEDAAKNAAGNSERLTRVESETSALTGKANSASQEIISLKTRAELLEEFQQTADALLKQLEAEQGDVSSWLEFDRNAGLLIGSQDEGHAADYIVQINGACISFYENRQAAKAGTEAKRVAYFQNHNLYVDNAWVGGYFNMGKFRFVNQTTGNMSLVWTGE